MVTKWDIKYWPPKGKNDVERWFNKLTLEQKASVAKVLVMLEKSGNELKLPHSRRLGKKLFELREKRFGYRIYYMFYKTHIIVLLAAADKSTQQHDIKMSRLRLAEVLEHGEEFL